MAAGFSRYIFFVLEHRYHCSAPFHVVVWSPMGGGCDRSKGAQFRELRTEIQEGTLEAWTMEQQNCKGIDSGASDHAWHGG